MRTGHWRYGGRATAANVASNRLLVLNAEKLGERLLVDVELADLVVAVARHLADPGTLVVPPLVFQAWGRKPSRDASSSPGLSAIASQAAGSLRSGQG